MEIKRKWIFIFLLVGGVTIQESSSCSCWDELDSTYKKLLPITKSPTQDSSYEYSYFGWDRRGSLKTCLCTDVLHLTSTFDISDPNLFDATEVKETEELELNITNTLRWMLRSELDANKVVAIEVVRNRSSAITSPNTQWKIDIVLKGRLDQENRINEIENLIKTGSSLNTDGTYNFGDVADVNGAEFKFEALTCLNSPPPAIENGSRDWNPTLNYPGAPAKYTCNTGFFLTGVTPASQTAISTCLHSTLMWKGLSSTVACKKGCGEEPPDRPSFTNKIWDSTMRKEGDKALYVCQDGFRPKHPGTLPNTTSTCTNSAWTAYDARFECVQILCPLKIPQVPGFADTNWHRTKPRYIDTTIVYFCQDGYKSTRGGNVTATCLDNGKWDPPPVDFACINEYDDQARNGSQIDYSDYDMTELPRNRFFLIVSVPSIIGLLILIFCLLCCCRTNSYLFIVCTGNARKTNYIH